MPQAQDNLEPPPAVCPACGYDMAGALGVTCPECGIDVVAETQRLSTMDCMPYPQQVRVILIPFFLGGLLSTWLAYVPFTLARMYPYDPMRSPWAWYLWTVWVLEWAAFFLCMLYARRIRAAKRTTFDRLVAVSHIQMLLLPFLGWLSSMFA